MSAPSALVSIKREICFTACYILPFYWFKHIYFKEEKGLGKAFLFHVAVPQKQLSEIERYNGVEGETMSTRLSDITLFLFGRSNTGTLILACNQENGKSHGCKLRNIAV